MGGGQPRRDSTRSSRRGLPTNPHFPRTVNTIATHRGKHFLGAVADPSDQVVRRRARYISRETERRRRPTPRRVSRGLRIRTRGPDRGALAAAGAPDRGDAALAPDRVARLLQSLERAGHRGRGATPAGLGIAAPR